MNERQLHRRICSPFTDESEIRRALDKKLPIFRWNEGDSSWDKVHVWGENPEATISIYRYESPGPFDLKIAAQNEAPYTCDRLLNLILEALQASEWKPLQPQPVTLITVLDGFPESYLFDCDRSLKEIKKALDDADFWYWELFQNPARVLHIEGRIPFLAAGRIIANSKERVRISGDKPTYTVEVGRWSDEAARLPTCDEVHETVQNTILSAIGAHNVRPAGP
jgi:hypothetical protein